MRSWRAAIRVLLDTQALILAQLASLPANVQNLLAPLDVEVNLSAVSLIEIAIKNASGKLDMSLEQTQRALRDLHVTVIPFEDRHAFQMFSLPQHHRDPFDRMILATALVEKLPVVTGDRIFHRYPGIKIIW